jgi:hypothetical protein
VADLPGLANGHADAASLADGHADLVANGFSDRADNGRSNRLADLPGLANIPGLADMERTNPIARTEAASLANVTHMAYDSATSDAHARAIADTAAYTYAAADAICVADSHWTGPATRANCLAVAHQILGHQCGRTGRRVASEAVPDYSGMRFCICGGMITEI